jgi:hypothetical protein
MQKRFGGDTAAIEADAAETLVAFDEDNLFAEVGGVEGGGVSTGTGADDKDLGVDGVHD